MSAIIIQQAAAPGERARLISSSSYHKHRPSSSSGSSISSASDPSDYGTVPGSAVSRGSAGIASHGQAGIFRSRPLKDTISPLRFVLTLVGIWSANFVFAFQASAIPTLAPTIGSGFNRAELGTYLGSVFTLASTAVIPLFGVLMETLGRRFAMLTACFFFGVGTVFCALAPSMAALIGARAFAGLGGGGLLTVSSVITTDLVPLRDRGIYQGAMMTVFGAGTMLGGPIAGILTDKYGWPWSFWVQLPVIVFCATAVSIVLPESPLPPTHPTILSGLRSIDWLGLVLLLGSVSTLILGFSFHTSFFLPWSSPEVWGCLVTAAIGAVIFVLVERRVKRPIMPLEVLRTGHVRAIMLGGFFLSVSNQSFMYHIPVYFSVILNSSTAEAGLILSLCGGLGLALGSLIAGQYIRRGGKYKWLGVICLIPGVTATFLGSCWTPSWPWWSYYATVLPGCLGYSIFLGVTLVALIASCDSQLMPKATATLYSIRSLGVTLGVSSGGSIQIASLTSTLKHSFKHSKTVRLPSNEVKEIINSVIHSKASIRRLPEPYQSMALDAYAHSIRVVFLFAFAVALCTWATSFFIQDIPLHEGSSKRSKVRGAAGVVDDLGEGLGSGTIEGETRRR